MTVIPLWQVPLVICAGTSFYPLDFWTSDYYILNPTSSHIGPTTDLDCWYVNLWSKPTLDSHQRNFRPQPATPARLEPVYLKDHQIAWYNRI